MESDVADVEKAIRSSTATIERQKTAETALRKKIAQAADAVTEVHTSVKEKASSDEVVAQDLFYLSMKSAEKRVKEMSQACFHLRQLMDTLRDNIEVVLQEKRSIEALLQEDMDSHRLRLQGLLKVVTAEIAEVLAESDVQSANEIEIGEDNQVGDLKELCDKTVQLAEVCSKEAEKLHQAQLAAEQAKEEKKKALLKLEGLIQHQEEKSEKLSKERQRRNFAVAEHLERCRGIETASKIEADRHMAMKAEFQKRSSDISNDLQLSKKRYNDNINLVKNILKAACERKAETEVLERKLQQIQQEMLSTREAGRDLEKSLKAEEKEDEDLQISLSALENSQRNSFTFEEEDAKVEALKMSLEDIDNVTAA
eukprot:g2464.t1